MTIGKRHLVLAALVLALGAAVYLNWQFAPSDKLVSPTVTGESADLGEAQYAASSAVSSADAMADGGAVEAGKKNNYFDEARSDREKTRADALATLQELINDPALNESQKSDAVNSAKKLAENMDKEAAIESLIKAKGYSDCVAVISDAQINIIIPAREGGLTSSDAAIIRDIVVGQTGVAPSCIKIIEAK